MRDIKFRAWDDRDKSMGMPFDLYSEVTGEQPIEMYNLWQNHILFLQYTGLRDKNGVEIYEGDIVKRIYSSWGARRESIHEITFGNLYWAGYEDSGGGIGFNIETDDETELGDRMEDYEVVGNIYENPELIQK